MSALNRKKLSNGRMASFLIVIGAAFVSMPTLVFGNTQSVEIQSGCIFLGNCEDAAEFPMAYETSPFAFSNQTFALGTAHQDGNNTSEKKVIEPGNETSTSSATIHILLGSSIEGARAYEPTPLDIKKGDAVTVFNDDSVMHTVTSVSSDSSNDSSNGFDTGFIDPGETAIVNSSGLDIGTYDYYCLLHPLMKGELKVS